MVNVNNGHISISLKFGRGVHHGDPISSHIFNLVWELLSSALNAPNISGVRINDSGYLLSLYAEDSSLILDECSTFLDNT